MGKFRRCNFGFWTYPKRLGSLRTPSARHDRRMMSFYALWCSCAGIRWSWNVERKICFILWTVRWIIAINSIHFISLHKGPTKSSIMVGEVSIGTCFAISTARQYQAIQTFTRNSFQQNTRTKSHHIIVIAGCKCNSLEYKNAIRATKRLGNL